MFWVFLPLTFLQKKWLFKYQKSIDLEEINESRICLSVPNFFDPHLGASEGPDWIEGITGPDRTSMLWVFLSLTFSEDMAF